MQTLLTVVSGLAWTIVYIEAIRVGLRQRTYAMPVAALALNIAWESIYGVHGLTAGLSVQTVVTLVWACADVVIVYTFLRFGPAEFGYLRRPLFLAWSALVFGCAYVVQWLFIVQFGVHVATRYSAFLQNLLMSGLFLAMLAARRGLRGQTLTIAVAKWLGTLAPTIALGALEYNALILGTGLLCAVLDLAYIGLVVWVARTPDAFTAPPSEARSRAGVAAALP